MGRLVISMTRRNLCALLVSGATSLAPLSSLAAGAEPRPAQASAPSANQALLDKGKLLQDSMEFTAAYRVYQEASRSTSLSIKAEAEYRRARLARMGNAVFMHNDDGMSSYNEINELFAQARKDGYGSTAGVAGQADADAAAKLEKAGDIPAALVLYQRAAEAGNPGANRVLGYDWSHAEGVPKDPVKARAYYLRSAELGDAIGQNNLATMLKTDAGGPIDLAGSLLWRQRAALQGNAKAEFVLGRLYLHGEGVPQDYARAAGLLLDAARQQYQPAADELVELANADGPGTGEIAYALGAFLYELGYVKYFDQIVAAFRLSMAHGYAPAEYMVGTLVNDDDRHMHIATAAAAGDERAIARLRELDHDAVVEAAEAKAEAESTARRTQAYRENMARTSPAASSPSSPTHEKGMLEDEIKDQKARGDALQRELHTGQYSGK